MKLRNHAVLAAVLLTAVVLGIAAAGWAADQVNVTGTWIVSVSGEAGAATQTMELRQDGMKITGTFQGPRQSGTVDGSVDGANVTLHVKARVPLDYTGTITGDTIKGTMTGRGKSGDFTATRKK
jgi:hypothetical protein